MNFDKDKVVGYEAKHCLYSAATDGSNDDVVLVKERVHLKDGTQVPNVRFITNYKRDFYIAREGHRNYNEKKSWEKKSKLQRFTTTQAKLAQNIARHLGRRNIKDVQLSMLCRSPYVYGADITTTALIKHGYMTKYPDARSESSVAVMDLETDVVYGTETIISGSLTFGNKIFLAATGDFISQFTNNPGESIQEKFAYYMNHLADDLQLRADALVGDKNKEKREVLEKRSAHLRKVAQYKVEFYLAEHDCDIAMKLFEKAHEWMPDFLMFWNMNFDIPKIIETLRAHNVDPKDVFSDPKLPYKYRKFKYREGQAIKTTATGKTMSKHNAELWHTLDVMASWYAIDGMCIFKQVRVTEGNRNSYSLDAILGEELDLGKLRFKEADEYTGLDWHVFMQKNYKIEYLVYNIFDCVSVEMLDAKNKDAALTVPALCGHSDYSKFPSTPRRLCDDMHFFVQKFGEVIGTTSDNMVEDHDRHVLGMNDWIVTLKSHLVHNNGLRVLKEFPHLATRLYAHVADLDVKSSYPNTEDFMNMSQETTIRELCKMLDIPEAVQRRAGINLTAARTNAVEVSCELFNFPTMATILEKYDEVHANG